MKRIITARGVRLLCLTVLFLACFLDSSAGSLAQTLSSQPVIVESRGSGEINSFQLDNLVFELRGSPAERLFVIARLGDGETARRLNRARLEGASFYLVASGRMPKKGSCLPKASGCWVKVA